MSRIIVIGSGFGGLSAAARLAARGHQVELFEKRDKLGGRAYVYDIDGYRFDGGPTVITAPWIFDEIWQAAGRRRQGPRRGRRSDVVDNRLVEGVRVVVRPILERGGVVIGAGIFVAHRHRLARRHRGSRLQRVGGARDGAIHRIE